MASSVKSLPNHYQTLGLMPTASEQEIVRAFARAMSMFQARSLSGAAQIGLAFEVLRNPAKRGAYDRALGLTPKARPDQSTVAATIGMNAGFMGSALSDLARQVAGENLPAPPQKPDLQARLEGGAEPKIASYIASSLRELPNPRISELAVKPIAVEKCEADTDAGLERHVAQLLAVRNAQEESALDDEVRTLEWKRPALALGGLIVAAGFIGTLAGLWVKGGSDEAPQPQTTVTMALPKAQTNSVTAPLPVAETLQPQSQPQSQPQPQIHSKGIAPRAQIVAPRQPAALTEQVAEASQQATPPSSEQVGAASDQLAAQSPAPVAVEAAMPLPKAVIAQTIEKIGYSCGTVASIAAEGAKPGVFKVSCSSGQNYQATPMNGRYHFKKMGSL